MLRLWPGERRPRAADVAAPLYDAAVRQARDPAFFRAGRVPDTVEGRFEVIALHVYLLVRRLSGEDGDAALSQAVFDAFFKDMDAALREIGVGDLVVGKKIKKMGEAFYGRAKAYGDALDAGDDAALGEALMRNLLVDAGAKGDAADVAPLAAYVRAAVEALSAQALTALMDGAPAFPSPPA